MGLFRIGVVTLLVALAVAVTGCAPAEDAETGLEPAIAPPVIAEAGVLRVAVDLGVPPYAGTDGGREAGIDIDVASALAAELGLKVEFVDVASGAVAEALAAGDVDAAMSVPFTEETIAEVGFAGWYTATGPALFSGAEETATARVGAGRTTAVQEGSQAYWDLSFDLGVEELFVAGTLREAFEALEAGEVQTVAGDALTGAYLLRDFPNLAFASQIGSATPVGIAVAPEAAELEDALRGALDRLATDGILDRIRTTWVGDLPVLEIEDLSAMP